MEAADRHHNCPTGTLNPFSDCNGFPGSTLSMYSLGGCQFDVDETTLEMTTHCECVCDPGRVSDDCSYCVNPANPDRWRCEYYYGSACNGAEKRLLPGMAVQAWDGAVGDGRNALSADSKSGFFSTTPPLSECRRMHR